MVKSIGILFFRTHGINPKSVLNTKCIGIALDQQTVFTRASCIQQPGILGDNALIESPNVKIYETRSSDVASAVQIQHYFYKGSAFIGGHLNNVLRFRFLQYEYQLRSI